MNLLRGLQAFVRIFCAEMRAKGKETTEPERQETGWQHVVQGRRAMPSPGGYRERIAGAMQGIGIVLAIGCWFAAIIAAIGAAVYAGWIIFTGGRDALLARGIAIVDPLTGYLVLGAWVLAFLLGAALTWIGGRMSADPKNRVDFSWRGFCRPFLVSVHEMAQLAGLPYALCFLVLWLILRLDLDRALFGSFLLIGAYLILVEKHQFFHLSDPRSPLLVRDRDRFNLQAWFCGECNKVFYPAHWLVQADTGRLPGYVAQCPECKGGNTQVATERLEKECEEAEARCNVCGAPPFSLACHRYSKEREAFWKSD